MKIGQVCMKIAGRDAGQLCVIVETLEGGFVLIDGNTRRRRCNLKHLELLEKFLDLEEGAVHSSVVEAMKEAGLAVVESKKRTKTSVKKEKTLKKRNQAKIEEKVAEIKAAKKKK